MRGSLEGVSWEVRPIGTQSSYLGQGLQEISIKVRFRISGLG